MLLLMAYCLCALCEERGGVPGPFSIPCCSRSYGVLCCCRKKGKVSDCAYKREATNARRHDDNGPIFSSVLGWGKCRHKSRLKCWGGYNYQLRHCKPVTRGIWESSTTASIASSDQISQILCRGSKGNTIIDIGVQSRWVVTCRCDIQNNGASIALLKSTAKKKKRRRRGGGGGRRARKLQF